MQYFHDEGSDDELSSFSDSGISVDSSEHENSSNDGISELIDEIIANNDVFVSELIRFSIKGASLDDKCIRRSAIVFLWKIFKHCGSDHLEVIDRILKTSEELLVTVKELIRNNLQELEVLFYLSGILHYVSRSKFGCQKILESFVDELFILMNLSGTALTNYSVTCLHNVVVFEQRSGYRISSQSRIQILISILQNSVNMQLDLVVIDILSKFAAENDVAKTILLDKGILLLCVNMFIETNHIKRFSVSVHMIRVMSVNIHGKDFLLKNRSFIHRLIFRILVLPISEKCSTRLLWSILLNLSDTLLTSINPFQFRVPRLISKMVKYVKHFQTNDVSLGMLEMVLCCLSNFSCGQEWIKEILINAQIPQTIASLITRYEHMTLKAVEACYRCINHVVNLVKGPSLRILIVENPSLIKFGNILNPKSVEDMENVFCKITLNDKGQGQRPPDEVHDDALAALRSWCLLMRQVIAKENAHFEQTTLKYIGKEAGIISDSFLGVFAQNIYQRPTEIRTSFEEVISHLNILAAIC